MKTQPIHVKDHLKDPTSGIVWEVIETRPGGHVELFDRTRVRFWGTYHRVVKNWERVKPDIIVGNIPLSEGPSAEFLHTQDLRNEGR